MPSAVIKQLFSKCYGGNFFRLIRGQYYYKATTISGNSIKSKQLYKRNREYLVSESPFSILLQKLIFRELYSCTNQNMTIHSLV